jgi:predicted alpha/beta-hydrolase family hydrolase
MMPDPELYSDATADSPVRGYLHHPQNANGDALVLSHGAGSNAQAPLLVALANQFASAGSLSCAATSPIGKPVPMGLRDRVTRPATAMA